MSQLVYDHHPSGLVVANQAADEASVRRALKQFDGRLMLDYAIDPEWGRVVWQVLCKTGSTTPPMVVCRWRDERTGEPLPLSHGLVEKAKRQHSESRAPKLDALEENDRLQEKIRVEDSEELDEYAKEVVERLRGKKSHNLPRGRYRRNTDFANVTDVR